MLGPLIIVLLVCGAVTFYLINKDEPETVSNVVKIFASNGLRKAVIAKKCSGDDFDLEMIAIDLLKIVETLDNLGTLSKEDATRYDAKRMELDKMLDEKLRELGILEEVDVLYKQDSDRIYGSTGKS